MHVRGIDKLCRSGDLGADRTHESDRIGGIAVGVGIAFAIGSLYASAPDNYAGIPSTSTSTGTSTVSVGAPTYQSGPRSAVSAARAMAIPALDVGYSLLAIGHSRGQHPMSNKE